MYVLFVCGKCVYQAWHLLLVHKDGGYTYT